MRVAADPWDEQAHLGMARRQQAIGHRSSSSGRSLVPYETSKAISVGIRKLTLQPSIPPFESHKMT